MSRSMALSLSLGGGGNKKPQEIKNIYMYTTSKFSPSSCWRHNPSLGPEAILISCLFPRCPPTPCLVCHPDLSVPSDNLESVTPLYLQGHQPGSEEQRPCCPPGTQRDTLKLKRNHSSLLLKPSMVSYCLLDRVLEPCPCLYDPSQVSPCCLLWAPVSSL